MARLTPQFSADRAVREYTEQHYIPRPLLPTAHARLTRARSAGRSSLGGTLWSSSGPRSSSAP